MIFDKTELTGEPNKQRCVVSDTSPSISLTSDLFLKSVGYKTLPLAQVPFDERTHTVPHDKGCVLTKDGKLIKGLFVSGWAKRGPVGIIDSTLRDSFETFTSIKYNLETGGIDSKTTTAPDTSIRKW